MNSPSLNTYFLPPCREDLPNFIKQSSGLLQIKNIEKNLQFLGSINIKDIKSRYLRTKFIYERKELMSLYSQFKPAIQAIPNSLPIEKSCLKYIERLTVSDNKKPIPLAQIENTVKQVYDTSPKNVFFLSDSHVTTYACISAFPTTIRKQLGLICFDKHIDIYGLKNEPRYFIAKHNFTRRLLAEEKIQAAWYIGAPYEYSRQFIQMRKRFSHIYYKKGRDNLLTLNAPCFIKDGKLIDDEILHESLSTYFLRLREMDINYVYLSIDFDCLDDTRESYTTTDFSTLSKLTKLSFVDLRSAIPQDKEFIKSLLFFLEMFSESYELYEEKQYKKVLTGFPKYTKGNTFITLKILCHMISLLKKVAHEFDIQLFCPIGNGNVVFGDITELAGHDYQEKSAKAVATLIQQILLNT